MAEEAKKKTSKATSTKKKTTEVKKKTTRPKKVVEKKVEEKKEETIAETVKDTVEAVTAPVKEAVEVVTAPVKDMIKGDFRKKPSAVVYVLIFLMLISMALVIVYSYFHTSVVIRKGEFIDMGRAEERLIYDDYYRVSTIEELKDIFPNKTFLNIQFDSKQYVVLSVTVNTCGERDLEPVGYTLDGNTVIVRIDYTASCGVCAPEYQYYLLEIENDVYFEDVTFDYHATNNPHCDPMVAYKPIIYLYPEEEMEVSVQLGNADYLTTTYPLYQDGWKVMATPDGTLKDLTKDREYYGLFWEGNHHISERHEEGFVVKGEDTTSFLEEKLSVLGLNDKEANEFIIYWAPLLEKNAYNYIYFETMDEINHYMPLTVNPTPDSIIRIQMDYEPLQEPITVTEQTLTTPERNGFTLVEWGGSIIKD